MELQNKISLCFLLVFVQIFQTITADVATRIDTLQSEVLQLREEMTELSKVVEDLEKTVKKNAATQKVDKVIASLLLNNQAKAAMLWTEMAQTVDLTELTTYLKTVIENSYLGNSSNFYYVLEFLSRNQLYMGYPILLQDLTNHHELYNSQEIFALAHQIKTACGTNNAVYHRLPNVIKELLGGPVILKNIDTNGYILASEESSTAPPCTTRQTCYAQPTSQVFVYRLPYRTSITDLRNNTRALWYFMAPTNVSDLSSGFHIKSKDQDLYLVFKQRMTSVFLRNHTVFDPYYEKDMNAQFLPMLIPDASPEENLIRIGIREKFFGKIEFIFGREFAKFTKVDVSRRAIYQGDLQGFVWEVIPVQNQDDNIGNDIDIGEASRDRCNFTM